MGILSYTYNAAKAALRGKGKVSPTIKSVKPNFKKTGKQTREDEYSKRVSRVITSKKKMEAGKKMMREAQKELKKEVDTKKAFQYKTGGAKSIYPIRPGEDMKKYKTILKEDKPEKKFKTGKELEREKKMGGGMMGRRFGMRSGTPKPKTNVQKIKETFSLKGLKKIDPKKQKGLAKLKKARPDVVRKMGYFKRGGRS